MTAPRHFLDLDTLPANALAGILEDALTRKQARPPTLGKAHPDPNSSPCMGKLGILLFESPSTRTRFSFELALLQTGGQPLTVNQQDLNLARGESLDDTARVLSLYGDMLIVRATRHQTLKTLASYAHIPVINALTPRSHPCQVVADLLTLQEHNPAPLSSLKVAWIGDGNNVAVSWIHAARTLGITLTLACPPDYAPPAKILTEAQEHNPAITLTHEPQTAATSAHCIITDTWLSINDPPDPAKRKALTPYRITSALMRRAHPEAIFLHCMPVYRGQEVSAEVADGPASHMLQAAENRLHAQKSILAWCVGALNP